MPVIGNIFEDAWDLVSGAASDVWEGAGDAVRALPGGDALLEASRDFANTSTGLTVLRAFSTTLYYSIAWPLGPQLASVAFAVPGLFRGDDFFQAWLSETKYRAETAVEMVGPGVIDTFSSQLGDTLQKLANEYGVGELADLGVAELAKRYNVREDVAATALSLWNKVRLPPGKGEFDPVTGRQLGAWQAAPKMLQLASCDAYADRRRRFGEKDPRPDIANQLRAACEASPEARALAAREYQLLYGAREWEALGYADRERAALARAGVSTTAAGEPVPRPRTSTAGDVALVALVGAAGAALVWFYVGDRK